MQERRGVPIVLTAPLTESIDHAGFFIQMSLASIPGVDGMGDRQEVPGVARRADDRRGPRRHGAGRACACSKPVLAREFGAEQVVVCYPDQLPQFIGERHPRRRGLDAQPARHDVRGRRLHVDLRVVARADQRALRATDVRHDPRSAGSGTRSRSIARRLRRLADRGDRHRSESSASTRVVSGRAESRDVIDLFRRALAGEALPRQLDAHHPHERGPTPRARQAARRSASSR